MNGQCANCNKKLRYIKRNCRCMICANCCKNTKNEDDGYSALEKALKVDHFPFLSKFEKELPSFSKAELAKLKELVDKAIEKNTTPGSVPSILKVKATVGGEPVKEIIVRGKAIKMENISRRSPMPLMKSNRQARYYIGKRKTADGKTTLVAHKKQESKLQDNKTTQPTGMKKPEEV